MLVFEAPPLFTSGRAALSCISSLRLETRFEKGFSLSVLIDRKSKSTQH
ncbi:hypothetical protein [Nostoc sp.]